MRSLIIKRMKMLNKSLDVFTFKGVKVDMLFSENYFSDKQLLNLYGLMVTVCAERMYKDHLNAEHS